MRLESESGSEKSYTDFTMVIWNQIKATDTENENKLINKHLG